MYVTKIILSRFHYLMWMFLLKSKQYYDVHISFVSSNFSAKKIPTKKYSIPAKKNFRKNFSTPKMKNTSVKRKMAVTCSFSWLGFMNKDLWRMMDIHNCRHADGWRNLSMTGRFYHSGCRGRFHYWHLLVTVGSFIYLTVTYFRGNLISRKWKRQILRDLAIWHFAKIFQFIADPH